MFTSPGVLTWIGEVGGVVLLGTLAHTWWLEHRGPPRRRRRRSDAQRVVASTHRSICGQVHTIERQAGMALVTLVDALELVAACGLSEKSRPEPAGWSTQFQDVVYVNHARVTLPVPYSLEVSEMFDDWEARGGNLRIEMVRHGEQMVFVSIRDEAGQGLHQIHTSYLEMYGAHPTQGHPLF